ncbi:MAG: PRTRC system protein B [Candidatus Competibacteraceae bacterium]|jgi:PRTRC genetic system protein B|nr:PRTRC system protein B [Candidatus Competibacteraceae bacterium]
MNTFKPALVTPEAPRPYAALVFFRAKHADRESALVTRHPVHLSDQGPVIGAGQVFGAKDQEELVAILQNRLRETQQAALIPPTVLAMGDRYALWVMPGKQRPLPIRAGDRRFSLTVPWPTLLVGISERGLYVAALASTRRPTERTWLFNAPLMNVNGRGHVCTGSADLPNNVTLATLPAWEAVITHTFFTHVNHSKTLRLTRPSARQGATRPATSTSDVSTTAHVRFWQRLAREGATRFPKEALVPMQQTVGDFLRRLLR